ncbi:MAG: LysM peptidoglycan-binding domain-containing protein [Firmicutes bacterium]|nr:LysM peptidoglycan-binding domain-containing protein [Bacillota bacterium]
MSINCEYESMRCPFFLTDFTRSIPVEGDLRLLDNLPPLDKITWGSFEVGAPKIAVYDDLVVITGKVYPYLVYLTEPGEYRIAPETEVEESRDGEIERREFSAQWTNETGVDYEERITVPGVRPGMAVEADLSVSNAIFEKVGPNQAHFYGQMEAVVHVIDDQGLQVISEVATEPPLKVSVSKEPIRVEEILDVHRETIPVETPLVLSNLKPGVARLLTYQARPTGVNWEANHGKVLIKGFIEISAIYVGCDDEGRPTEIFSHDWNRASGTAVPFETVFNLEIPDGEQVVIPRVIIQNSGMELKTSREIRYRADLECEAMISRIIPKEIVTDVVSDSDLILDTQKYLLNLEEYLGEKTGTVNLETTLTLPGGEVPERLLSWQGIPAGITLEAVDGKVLVDGKLDLRLIYAVDNGDGSRIRAAGWESRNNTGLPLEGVIEFQEIQPGALLRAQAQLDSLDLELAADKSIQVKGTATVRVIARSPRALMALRDCAAVEPVDPATRPSMLFYVVQPGDSLWKIARRYQTTVDALARVNQIANPDRIDIGQKLIIPKQVG